MIVSYDTITYMTYKPPFTITPYILLKSQQIARELGIIVGRKFHHLPLQLRRTQTIKSIQASLSIEAGLLHEKILRKIY